jgi:ribosomal protein S27AE
MVYIGIALGSALLGGYIGRSRGSSFWLWFLISGLVPLLGPLAAALYRSERDELRRQCPNCGKVLKLHDQVCNRCGTDLDFPELAIEPESAHVTPR